MARESEKEALIRRLEASRQQLGVHVAAVRHKLDVPRRVREHVARKPLLWFGGSLGVGLVASRLLRRPRKKTKAKAAGLMGILLPTLVAVLKPLLKHVVTSELQRRLMANAHPESTPPETRFPLSKP